MQNSQDIRENFRYLLPVGNNLKYSSKTPDQNIWGGDGDGSLWNLKTEYGIDVNSPGWWRGLIRTPTAAIGATIEALFFPAHDPHGSLGSPGQWYRGEIVYESCPDETWEVRFEDDDEEAYPYRDFKYNLDVRVLSSPEYKLVFVGNGPNPHEEGSGQRSSAAGRPGPWEIWLKTNLSDLLLSIFRASRRNAQLDNNHIREIIACLSFK